jgi:hypothetical protein
MAMDVAKRKINMMTRLPTLLLKIAPLVDDAVTKPLSPLPKQLLKMKLVLRMAAVHLERKLNLRKANVVPETIAAEMKSAVIF